MANPPSDDLPGCTVDESGTSPVVEGPALLEDPALVEGPALPEVPPAAQLAEFLSRSTTLNKNIGALTAHGDEAIRTLHLVVPVIAAGNADIGDLILDSIDDLHDAYLSIAQGRIRAGFAALRGVMEGIFTALYYRQQSISLRLWVTGKSFNMVHQFLDPKHEFHQYYRQLFEDEGFKRLHPKVTYKRVFEEADNIYDLLSGYVHKKGRSVQQTFSRNFEEVVERVLRISLTFLDTEDELPTLSFPSPPTFAQFASASKRG